MQSVDNQSGQIRDEQLRDAQARPRLKRRFMEQTRTSAAAPTVPHVSNPTPTSETPNISTDHDIDMDDDSPAPTAVPTRPGFRALIEEEIARVGMDDEDNDPLFPGPTANQPRLPLISLADIFDYQNNYWKDTIEKAALATFDEELELFQLLDLDAEGEDDDDFDEITTQALLG